MARYNRINLDGKSKTMTATVKASVDFGSVVSLNADKEFIQSTDKSQMFVLGGDYQQGKYTDGELAAGETGVAEYLESGRKLAVLATAGTYKTGDALMVSGVMVLAADSDSEVLGYAAEDVTLEEESLLAVSIK